MPPILWPTQKKRNAMTDAKESMPCQSDFGAGSELRFSACGRGWRLRRADMEELWAAMSEDDPGWKRDERLPYWAELWPSSLALAAWLEDRRGDIAGCACLDLGCGLGFTALVGQWLGGRVMGMDYDAEALEYARLNARLNAVPGVTWTLMDWREPTLEEGSIHRVWAADIVYEQRFAAPVAAFLAHVLSPGGTAWIAEPGRTVFRALLDEAPAHGLSCAKVSFRPTWPLTAQTVPVPVSIWEIRRTTDSGTGCVKSPPKD